jgi:hypothetical protein
MADFIYKDKRNTFQTPYTNGPDNCPNIRERIGQTFEIIGVSILETDEDSCVPYFHIKFPDGLTIDAHEEEAFNDAGWNP